MLQTIEIYLLLFFIYSILGWLMEVTLGLIENKKIVNRGFLIGPYCPIYGCGVLLITLLLKKYYNYKLITFVLAILICSVLEYYTSYFMEKIFKARWWDYSNSKFNINGRICLETIIPFGIIGCFIIYYTNPFFIKVLNIFPLIVLHIASVFFLIIFIIDAIISLKVISNLKTISKTVKDNTEEISEKVMNILKGKKVLHVRVFNAFPLLDKKLELKEKVLKEVERVKKKKNEIKQKVNKNIRKK